MSKREKVLVVDVETCGSFASPRVYDLGYAVVERTTGKILESASLVIEDVFYGMPEKMDTAYYADKLPGYHAGIAAGAWRVVSAWAAWRMVKATMVKHGITKVYAYNAAFDKGALNNTMKVVTGGTCRNFFPKGTQFCCIWHMACQTVMCQKNFRKFCVANGFVSEAGNLRTSAEVCYGYITKSPDFTEAHTGLDDVIIETEILHRVIRQHKRVNEKIAHNPWRIPQGVNA
jgi:hypothetical protein